MHIEQKIWVKTAVFADVFYKILAGWQRQKRFSAVVDQSVLEKVNASGRTPCSIFFLGALILAMQVRLEKSLSGDNSATARKIAFPDFRRRTFQTRASATGGIEVMHEFDSLRQRAPIPENRYSAVNTNSRDWRFAPGLPNQWVIEQNQDD